MPLFGKEILLRLESRLVNVVWVSLIPWSTVASRVWVPHPRLIFQGFSKRTIVVAGATSSWTWPLSLHGSLYFSVWQVTRHIEVIALFELFFWHHSFYICHWFMRSNFHILVLNRSLDVLRRRGGDNRWSTSLDVGREIDCASLLRANCDSAYSFRRIFLWLTQLIVQHIIQIFLTIIFSVVLKISVRHGILFYSLGSFSTVKVLAKLVVVGRARITVMNRTVISGWA